MNDPGILHEQTIVPDWRVTAQATGVIWKTQPKINLGKMVGSGHASTKRLNTLDTCLGVKGGEGGIGCTYRV